MKKEVPAYIEHSYSTHVIFTFTNQTNHPPNHQQAIIDLTFQFIDRFNFSAIPMHESIQTRHGEEEEEEKNIDENENENNNWSVIDDAFHFAFATLLIMYSARWKLQRTLTYTDTLCNERFTLLF